MIDTSTVLAFTVTGSTFGALAGPVGAVAGGVLGGVIGTCYLRKHERMPESY